MQRQIGMGSCVIFGGLTPGMSDRKHSDHTKKVKDLDRAVRSRKKHFGSDSVGNPVDKADPKHVIKKGRTIGGRQMEVDKNELVKALSKDPRAVAQAQESIRKSPKK